MSKKKPRLIKIYKMKTLRDWALNVVKYIKMEFYIDAHLKITDYTNRETNYKDLCNNWYIAKRILGYE